jgi:hypothetical protein
VVKAILLSAIGLLVAAAPECDAFQSGSATAGGQRREFPLNCRGGAGLIFDTLGPVADTATRVRLSLRFTPSPRAAGWKGEGLAPSTCAWVDRPLEGSEPLRIHVRLGAGDSTPRLTLRDTSLYWSFLAYDTDSGYLHGVGYRHWNAGDAVAAMPSSDSAVRLDYDHWKPTPTPAATPGPGKFNVRYVPLLLLGWILLIGIPIGIPTTMLLGRWSGWRRLAALYPERPIHGGRRFRCSLIMRVTWYRGGVRLTADDSHLHFSVWPLYRPGHRPFSVPWSDVSMSRDEWPWLPFKGLPVVRLTLAKEPNLRILVQMSIGEGIIAASGGRLELNQSPTPAADNQLVRR